MVSAKSTKKPANLFYGINDIPPMNVLIPLVVQQLAILSGNLIYPVLLITTIGGTLELSRTFMTIALIATGVGTILQALRNSIVGSGFLCVVESGSMFFPASLMALKAGGLPLLFGMTALAGVFEILLATIIRRLRSVIPPEVIGLVVTVVGISVIKTSLSSFFGANLNKGFLIYDRLAVIIGLITLVVIVSINIWGKVKLRPYSILVGMAAGYVVSYFTGIITVGNVAKVANTPWFSLPAINRIGWSFSSKMLFPFAIAVICSSIKMMGNITTCQKSNDSEWRRLDMETIRGGIMAEGLSTTLSGLFGGMGMSGSSGSIGLSIATGATSRRIAFIVGGMCIFLAFFPKLSMLLTIIPRPVMGAILIINVTFIILTGLQILVSRMMDARKIFVIGLPFIFGLGVEIMPDLYRSFPDILQPLLQSSLTLVAISSILLNCLFHIGIASKKSIELQPGSDTATTLFEFIEAQGNSWGARPEVIRKAASALSEFGEVVTSLNLATGKIKAQTSFDEFNLDITVYYDGSPMSFPNCVPSKEELLTDETAYTRLAGYLISKYVDKIRSESEDGKCTLYFHFNH